MEDILARTMLGEIVAALGLPADCAERVSFTGTDQLPSCYRVTDLAIASIGAANLAVSELVGRVGAAPLLAVDRRLASVWFGFSILPKGWKTPPAWDAIAGDYRTADGWIKLHTNAPHHRQAVLDVLACAPDRERVADAVASWTADALEQAIANVGGCAAALRTEEQWNAHPQGRAVAGEPLIIWHDAPAPAPSDWSPMPGRPLAGLRVLDLTRVLAGPVATRFLAGYGAEVLRIDQPGWDEPAVIPEVTLGKKCARLDLRDNTDRETFEDLLRSADILVHGYRIDALGKLGYGPTERQALRPGLIDISLNAYGHDGPWATRRGFDSLVQLSSGIAEEGMKWRGSDAPISLPVPALDHATGYLLAAASVRAVTERLDGGQQLVARMSLARTSHFLRTHRGEPVETEFDWSVQDDLAPHLEQTSWGPARRVKSPCLIQDNPMCWKLPATALGSSVAAWTA